MMGVLLFSQDESAQRIAAEAPKFFVMSASSRQDSPFAVACVSSPNPCSFPVRAERRRINPFACQLASHGADFDVALDVRKIRYQPISNGGEGCASKYFPDDMI